MPTQIRLKASDLLNATVIVSALGYFVDIYDLVLFSIVRVSSLKSIGVPETDLLKVGVHLLNTQMLGMLVGGIFWGIVGDKRGRLSVLFGSIFLYSIANILNAFVSTVPQYAGLRFLAGLGLAGELGAAITLVSEILPKETRGYGTTAVAAIGVMGAIVAGTIGDLFSWQVSYLVGGALGLLLLVLRIGTFESGLFNDLKSTTTERGNILMLFTSWARFSRYLASILVGVPIWFVIGILITFSPELSKELNALEPISAGRAILFSYAGLSVGDFFAGILSQLWGNRKKVILLFLFFTFAALGLYLRWRDSTAAHFYLMCFVCGLATGYWAVFVSTAAEQFGTNLRATVTTTVPNFVRGSLVPITMCFQWFHASQGLSLLTSAGVVGVVCLILALLSLFFLRESFATDLNYLEK